MIGRVSAVRERFESGDGGGRRGCGLERVEDALEGDQRRSEDEVRRPGVPWTRLELVTVVGVVVWAWGLVE